MAEFQFVISPPVHLIFSKMSQDPVLMALIAESQREADEKAYKKRLIREIIKLRKRLGLGKDHSICMTSKNIRFFLIPLFFVTKIHVFMSGKLGIF